MSRSLEQWLAHQTQAHPQAIDLGLERLAATLERLAWRAPSVPVVTVAGTNGKGSVAAYCTSILRAAGHRVGTFTSPHLRDYRERICVHDRFVTAHELVDAFERIEAACAATVDRPGLSLSFFEYNALAAFLVFDAARLDAWVLEVGLGGRLDAVNIIDPTVAVVVSIGLDHQEYLGTTLEAIAHEKAGIFRAGHAAVIADEAMPGVLTADAVRIGARPLRAGQEYAFARHGAGWDYRGSCWDLRNLPPPALAGEAQFGNAAAALAALEALEARLPVTPAAIARGLAEVRLVGRFQVIAGGPSTPSWILDVAHNPAAARVLAQNLRAMPARGRTFAVCGILMDKDAGGIAHELRGCFDAWWLLTTEGARGSSGAVLAERIAPAAGGAPRLLADTLDAACAAALAAAQPEDRIVVFGSFHTVGPALDWLESRSLLPSDPLLQYTAAPGGQ